MPQHPIRAVLFDFGGVITTSPFEAFRRFERERGLPDDFLRQINSSNHENNAWARFERNELSASEFDAAFAAEARAAGHEVRGLEVVALVYGSVRPQMVAAVKRCHGRFITACLTNNFRRGAGQEHLTNPVREQAWEDALALFDEVIESSRIGVRKPERKFFELACEKLGIAPNEAVFLDDLGINLKVPRDMGMYTIKVTDPDAALAELSAVLGIQF